MRYEVSLDGKVVATSDNKDFAIAVAKGKYPNRTMVWMDTVANQGGVVGPANPAFGA